MTISDERSCIASALPTKTELPGRPLVSVVIPAYNCGEYLKRAIVSVFEQTYPRTECIVINDGSTDNTAEIAMSCGGNVQLVNQANAGASAARNCGIAAAKGSLIAFLDADDCWHPRKLEKQVSLLERHPEVVLVSTDLKTYKPEYASEADAEICIEASGTDIHEIYTDLLPLFRDPYLGTPSVVVRTDRAREIGGFDTTLPIAEDVDFYFRACAGRSYARLKEPLTIIFQRSGSLTRTLPGYQYNLEVIDKVARSNPEFARVHANEFAKQRLLIYSRWIERSLYAGRGHQARRLLRESRAHGRLDGYRHIALKSFCAWPIAIMRRWVHSAKLPSGRPMRPGS
tara:strand:+ start:2504 stop:3532 length:1029 start_codon:yes stop_codon:yes gene_type:complete